MILVSAVVYYLTILVHTSSEIVQIGDGAPSSSFSHVHSNVAKKCSNHFLLTGCCMQHTASVVKHFQIYSCIHFPKSGIHVSRNVSLESVLMTLLSVLVGGLLNTCKASHIMCTV